PLPSSLLAAAAAGEFMPIFTTGANPELPGDQQGDDACSATFDTPPLAAPLEILGNPVAMLELACDGVGGQLVARLCEAAPDGRSRRVAWGARNLALADDLASPMAPDPGGRLRVVVPLHAVADSVAAGSRLRLALSTSYWPILWPVGGAPPLRLIPG